MVHAEKRGVMQPHFNMEALRFVQDSALNERLSDPRCVSALDSLPIQGNASPYWHTTTIVPAWKYTGGITCAACHWCDTHYHIDSVPKSGGKNGAAARCPWLMSQINEGAIRADRKSLRDENKTNKT